MDVVDLAAVERGVAGGVGAPAVADQHGGAGGAGEETPADTDVETLEGPSNTTRSTSAWLEDGHELAGGDHLAVGELADPAERLLADQHLQQHPGLGGVGGLGGGAFGHESQRIRAPLAAGAAQVLLAGAVTHAARASAQSASQSACSRRSSSRKNDGAADRVEQGVDDHDVVQGPGGGQLAGLERPPGPLLGQVGLVEVLPVGEGLLELGHPQPGRRTTRRSSSAVKASGDSCLASDEQPHVLDA